MTIPQNIVDTCASFGFKPETAKVNSMLGQDMFSVWHKGVQYTIDSHGRTLKDGMPDIGHQAKHLQVITSAYHEKIKFIYNFLMSKKIGDIWVMSGGGMQIQAFFGNSTGYVGIFYLNLDSEEATPYTKQTFIVNWKKNDKLFKESGIRELFSLHKIELKLHEEIYPEKDNEKDDDYDLIYNS